MLTLPDYPLRQREFLLEISRAITARLDLSEVLRRVLHASVVMTAGKVGMIALREQDDGLFYVRAVTGISRENIPTVNEQLHEILLNATGDDFFDYLDSQLGEMAKAIDDSLRQSVAMPLVFDKRPLGLLVVFRSYQAEVTRNDIQILHSFADQAAIAVHNAQLYERIDNERQRLSAILDYSGDGVMILDADLSIMQVNHAFESITACDAEQAVGQKLQDVLHWQTRDQQLDLPQALEDGWGQQKTATDKTLYVEGEIERDDGLTIGIGITYAPLFNADGKLSSIIANVRDVTNRRKAQEMQNVFISTVSHELRTPVALIKGYANTLSRTDAKWDSNTIQQSLGVIEDEADRLTELIDDLLIASKIQAESDVSLTLADVHLDDMAHRSLERFQTQSTRHKFVFSFTENFPSVTGDAKLLRQVIDNLLTNAIKYSPKGGTVTIGGRYNGETVTLFVRDEGDGIPETERAKIFDRFYRVDDQLSRKTEGTGLGLYLSKVIIEAHDGTIHVKSQVGHGSTFYFTIPRD